MIRDYQSAYTSTIESYNQKIHHQTKLTQVLNLHHIIHPKIEFDKPKRKPNAIKLAESENLQSKVSFMPHK